MSVTPKGSSLASLAALEDGRARAKDALAAPHQNLPALDDAMSKLRHLVAQKKGAIEVGEPLRRSFATSEFKRLYSQSGPVTYQHELFAALHSFLRVYAGHVGVPVTVADQMFKDLQTQVIDSSHWDALLGEVEKIAVVLWTSNLTTGFAKEFCSILNQVIREDMKDVLPHAVVLCRAMATLIVTRRQGPSVNQWWPSDLMTHRGTSVPRESVDFFTEGLLYRVPMFLATSCLESTAIRFMQNAPDGLVPVHFKFHLDPVKKCDHALYVEGYTLCGGEEELLYAPHSAFKVLKVLIPDGVITWDNPIVIDLLVQPNNKTVPEDVPLASWH